VTSLVWNMRAKSLNLSSSITSLFRLKNNYRYRFTGVLVRTAFVTGIPGLLVPALIYGGTTPHKFTGSSVELIAGAVILGISWVVASIFWLLER
jgi:hypothetical protein